MCSLAVRRATRITNPRVVAVQFVPDIVSPGSGGRAYGQKIGSSDQKIGFTFHVPDNSVPRGSGVRPLSSLFLN